jgi:hypothetical protein
MRMPVDSKPRLAKAHSQLVADEFLRLGWTLRTEFYAEGDAEPYEYLLSWEREEEPPRIDWDKFFSDQQACKP